MDGSWIKGIVVGAVIATAGGAVAGYNVFDGGALAQPTVADVMEVAAVTEAIATPREVCEDVTITHKKPPRDKHRLMGTATGAIIGGVLGNQVGGGTGKKVATVAGAAAGGYAGNKIQQRAQSDDTYTTVEQQCNTVTEYVESVVGYDVTYRIGDEQGQVRMDRDPGDSIPLVDGELALN